MFGDLVYWSAKREGGSSVSKEIRRDRKVELLGSGSTHTHTRRETPEFKLFYSFIK